MKLVWVFDTKFRDNKFHQKSGDRVLLWAKPESRYLYAYVKNSEMGEGYIGKCKVMSNEYMYFLERNHYKASIGTISDSIVCIHVEIVDSLLKKRSIIDKIYDFLS